MLVVVCYVDCVSLLVCLGVVTEKNATPDGALRERQRTNFVSVANTNFNQGSTCTVNMISDTSGHGMKSTP